MLTKRILVTGACGFIGQALTKSIMDCGYDVVGTSRSPQYKKNGALKNLVTVTDLNDIEKLSETLKNVDVVVHLANPNSINKIDRYRFNQILAEQIEAVTNIANIGKNQNLKKFIYISSAKVLGEKNDSDCPLTNYSPVKPETAYALMKARIEDAVVNVGSELNLPYVIIRPPIVYGPGVKGNIFSLIRLADTLLPWVFGKRQNKRSYVYIGNLVDAIILSIESEQVENKALLVTDDQDISTSNLFGLIKISLGRKNVKIPSNSFLAKLALTILGQTSVVERVFDSLYYDISNTKDLLNWSPPHTVDFGICELVKWYLGSHKKTK